MSKTASLYIEGGKSNGTERKRNRLFALNGAPLYYEVAGEGEPLVLIHAGVADSRMWDEQFEEFVRQYRVVRYDWRGYGKSAVPDRPVHGDSAR